jgi:hypothetical protein
MIAQIGLGRGQLDRHLPDQNLFKEARKIGWLTISAIRTASQTDTVFDSKLRQAHLVHNFVQSSVRN